MAKCTLCSKKSQIGSWSRHKKGSSGHGGEWNLKAHIHARTQKPNLHMYKGNKYCTKCLRIVKPTWVAPKAAALTKAASLSANI